MKNYSILCSLSFLLLFSCQSKGQEIKEQYSNPIHLVLPFSHSTRITSLAFSPDGQYLVTGDLDGWVKVWALATGAPVSTLKAHQNQIYHLSFTAERSWCSASNDGTVKLWQLGSDQPVKMVGSMDEPVRILTTAKKDNFALVLYQNSYQLWELDHLQVTASKNGILKQLPAYDEDLKITSSADMNYIAYRDTQQLSIIDLQKNETIYTRICKQGEQINLGAFSNDNRYFAFNLVDQFSYVEVFDINTESIVRKLTFRQLIPNLLHVSNVDALSFLHEDSNFLLTAGMDAKIRLWDISTGHEITNYEPDDMAEPTDGKLIYGLSELGPGGVTALQAAPSDQYFVAVTKKELSTWALRSFIQKTKVAPQNNHLTGAEIHPDLKTITLADKNGRIVNIDARSGEELGVVKSSGKQVSSLKVLNEQLLFVELEDGQLEMHNRDTGAKLCAVDPVQFLGGQACRAAANHQYIAAGVAAQDQSIGRDALQVWSASSGKALYTIPGFTSGIHQIAISPDGRYIAFSGNKTDDGPHSSSNYIRVWSTTEKKLLEDTRTGFYGGARHLAFSADGNRLLVISNFGELHILDVAHSCWVGKLSIVSRGPIDAMDEMQRGEVSFIRFGNTGIKEVQQPSEVQYSDNVSFRNESAPFRIPLPEDIAALHPVTEQILIGYEGGGLLVFNLVISLNEAHERWDGQPYPYAPFHPFYMKEEENFLTLHQGVILDAKMSDNENVAMSIGTDSDLKQSAFFIDEDNIPSLDQWTTHSAALTAIHAVDPTNLFLGKANGDVLMCNLASPAPASILYTQPTEIGAISSDPTKQWMASCDRKGNLLLFHLTTQKEYRLEDDNPYYQAQFERLLFSPDGRYLLGTTDNGRYNVWDVNTQEHLTQILPGGPVSGVQFLSNDQIVVSYDEYEPAEGQEKLNLDYFDVRNGEIVKSLTNEKGHIHSLSNWEEQQVAWFLTDEQLIARAIDSPGIAGIAELERPEAPLEYARLSKDGRYIVTVEGIHAFVHNEQTGERKVVTEDIVRRLQRANALVDKTPLEQGWILRVEPRSVNIYNLSEKHKIKRWPLPADCRDFLVLNDSISVFSRENGVLQWFDYIRGNVKVNTYFPGEKDFIAYTPDNYYYASKQLAAGLYYSNGLEAFSFDQFDLIYNRPDLVIHAMNEKDSTLTGLYRSAYEKRIKETGWSINPLKQDYDVPQLELLSKPDLTLVKHRDFTFSFKASGLAVPLEKALISINDVPIYGGQGIQLASNKKSITQELTVPLNVKDNLIKVSVVNQAGIASPPLTLSVYYEAPEQKPDLYLITIGVSDYEGTDKDLQYAAKDAKDLAELYQSAEGFRQIHTKILTDQQVTKTNILALRQWLEQSQVDDQVLLYVSGHGLIDNSYNFYYATHHMDFGNPSEKGILYEEIEGLLDGIPARKKLLLMDACHSGEFDEETAPLTAAQRDSLQQKGIAIKAVPKGDEEGGPTLGLQNSFELMRQLFVDLRRGSGATVITSSAGVQVSYEDAEWQNGAFTYAFLYGLKSMKADANQDGQVTASEIQAFVAEFVPRLTEGLQVPTFRRENLEFDFRVW